MWPIVTPEKQTNTRNVAFKNETNRPVDWLRYWLSALLRCHSKTDEYNIQKQTRIAGTLAFKTTRIPASVATSQQLEAWAKPENVEKCQGSGRMYSLSVKMIRTAVRAAALSKMLGFVKVLSYIGPWRTVLTGSIVTRMVTHYGKLLYELQRYVVYQARPIC